MLMLVTVTVVMIVIMVMLVVVILPGLMRMFVSVLVIAMGMAMGVPVLVIMRPGMLMILPGSMGVLVGMLMITMGMSMAVRVTVLVVMVMLMIFVIGFEMDIHFDAGNAAFFLLVHMQVVAFELQLAEFTAELLRAHAQINERAKQHVTTNATKNVEVERFHLFTKRLIWLAAYPAPKPLSILTTVTPLPQLFNMPSNAATPPKLAP